METENLEQKEKKTRNYSNIRKRNLEQNLEIKKNEQLEARKKNTENKNVRNSTRNSKR